MKNHLVLIKTWTPRVAIIFAIVLFTVAFWGIIQLGFRFFQASSYFTPEIKTETSVPGLDEEQVTKLRDFMKARADKRDAVSNYQNLGLKDPFNLP